MQIYDVIEAAQGGEAMANLAETTGIAEAQARAAAQAVLPELAFALERNTLSRGGLADLVTALGQGHHEQILEMPQAWSDPRVIADGNAILENILGSRGKIATLSDRAQRATGLGDGVLRMLLPLLAQLLMGAIARSSKGGLGDILSRLPLPGGNASPGGGGQSRPVDMGGGGRGLELPRMDRPQGGFPMPPIPGDDTPAPGSGGGFGLPWPGSGTGPSPQSAPQDSDDGPLRLPRVDRPPGGFPMPPMPSPGGGSGGGYTRGGDGGAGNLPLPLPRVGGDNPYGDLSDILRRRGTTAPAAGGEAGGTLWSIVRSVLGGALGFGGRGVFGWIIQLLVMRWGWGLLRRLLLGR